MISLPGQAYNIGSNNSELLEDLVKNFLKIKKVFNLY